MTATPIAPMSSTAQRITVRHGDENYGPYLLQDVNQLLVSGRVDRDDLAWIEGEPEWQPLHTVAGVISVPPMPPGGGARRAASTNTGSPYPDEADEHANSSSRRIVPAFLMAFFVGVFGVHRFYVGKTGSAIAMLLLTISVIGVIVSAIWATIDWIMILCASFEDDQDKRLTRWT